ncbi:flagellar basal body rod protein FlgF [Citrobacter koseri]|uniref:Flagellar basal-body rod protein FlgF n=1 Tax=Citrobacter koseri TaxID=545 RepID=A0A3S4IH91_CITKO|nr:flagellar basal body rod protein FlgF [Citrobacter koseri]
MDRLIFTAMSGASRSLSQQQIHANNLANVNTQGFRSDLDNAISQQVNGEGYASRYMALPTQGGVDMTPGAVRETGRNLDIAIKGDGLIALASGNREVYTRNGRSTSARRAICRSTVCRLKVTTARSFYRRSRPSASVRTV